MEIRILVINKGVLVLFSQLTHLVAMVITEGGRERGRDTQCNRGYTPAQGRPDYTDNTALSNQVSCAYLSGKLRKRKTRG